MCVFVWVACLFECVLLFFCLVGWLAGFLVCLSVLVWFGLFWFSLVCFGLFGLVCFRFS